MGDDSNNLRQQLCAFVMHQETPFESIFGQHTPVTVFQEINAILRTAEPESIMHTLMFVQDAYIYKNPYNDVILQYLQASEIWERLQVLLQAPNYHVRFRVIYVIGKLCQNDRAYLLADAFPFFLENDPINLPGLLFEFKWLTKKWNWDFVERMAVAKHYLVRWALCEVLEETVGGTPEVSNRALGILARLKGDSHSLIVAEATLRIERVKAKLGPKLPKAEWRKEVKRIAQIEPKITFDYAATRFISNIHHRPDYSLEEFDAFVSGMA